MHTYKHTYMQPYAKVVGKGWSHPRVDGASSFLISMAPPKVNFNQILKHCGSHLLQPDALTFRGMSLKVAATIPHRTVTSTATQLQIETKHSQRQNERKDTIVYVNYSDEYL